MTFATFERCANWRDQNPRAEEGRSPTRRSFRNWVPQQGKTEEFSPQLFGWKFHSAAGPQPKCGTAILAVTDSRAGSPCHKNRRGLRRSWRIVVQRGGAATQVWHGHPGRGRFTGWKPVPRKSSRAAEKLANSRTARRGRNPSVARPSWPWPIHGLEARATRIVAGCGEVGE